MIFESNQTFTPLKVLDTSRKLGQQEIVQPNHFLHHTFPQGWDQGSDAIKDAAIQYKSWPQLYTRSAAEGLQKLSEQTEEQIEAYLTSEAVDCNAILSKQDIKSLADILLTTKPPRRAKTL